MNRYLKDLLWLGVTLTAFLSLLFMYVPVDLVFLMAFIFLSMIVMVGNCTYRWGVSRIEFFLVCALELASFTGAFFFRTLSVALFSTLVFLIRLASIRAEEKGAIHNIA